MSISEKAFNLIVQEETGGEVYYVKTEQSTDWPGGASGTTVGIGYDCGFSTASEIRSDWSGKLPDSMVAELASCAGIHGTPARSLAHELKGKVIVPWETALEVFKEKDVPKWERIVAAALPNTADLSADSFGALVSLAFNRGASFDLPGSRYTEMRQIKALMEQKAFDKIPDQIRAMSRLWPKNGDLYKRRYHEAELFEEGLTATA